MRKERVFVVDVLETVPISRRLPPGRHGAQTAVPGVTAGEIFRAAATLVAGRGQASIVMQAAKAAFGLELCDGPRCVASGSTEFIGAGPGRWLVLAEGESEALTQRLETAAAPQASVVDQSGGLVLFEASGEKIADALPKFLSIDIDASVFPVGAAATTTAAHVNLTVWLARPGCWRFAVGRSSAAAFLRILAVAAAEFGFELR
jgi:sarcosine oxidase subunit gamma